jgi:hypothetical protein
MFFLLCVCLIYMVYLNFFLDYKCQCPDWTLGKNCEVVFNPCSRVNCMNNGNCLKRRTLAYECNCTQDYTGLLCDQAVLQTCKATRCAYGSCELNQNGQYACACATPGYEGPFCEGIFGKFNSFKKHILL